jgi:hypothetical protein
MGVTSLGIKWWGSGAFMGSPSMADQGRSNMAQIMQVECQLIETLRIQFEEKRHFFDDLNPSSGNKLPQPGSVCRSFADTQGVMEIKCSFPPQVCSAAADTTDKHKVRRVVFARFL